MLESYYKFVTTAERPDIEPKIHELTSSSWPAFMYENEIADVNFKYLFSDFPEYQFGLIDTRDDSLVAQGNSISFYWDKPVEQLPDEGWEWVLMKGIEDRRAGRTPNYQSALQICISPQLRSKGASGEVVKAMRSLGAKQGIPHMVAPVRPNRKSDYPLIPMDDYIKWKTEEGLPFDAWMRVHARLGARVVSVCHKAFWVKNSIASWEKWTGLRFLQSGQYIIPGALNPIEIDLKADIGTYCEPNVWMYHPPK
ncbi:MAG: GNAT family N-acetyltransferase [bacterium]|nr:GNAT family N-acetyltransferase [bacterium]